MSKCNTEYYTKHTVVLKSSLPLMCELKDSSNSYVCSLAKSETAAYRVF